MRIGVAHLSARAVHGDGSLAKPLDGGRLFRLPDRVRDAETVHIEDRFSIVRELLPRLVVGIYGGELLAQAVAGIHVRREHLPTFRVVSRQRRLLGEGGDDRDARTLAVDCSDVNGVFAVVYVRGVVLELCGVVPAVEGCGSCAARALCRDSVSIVCMSA